MRQVLAIVLGLCVCGAASGDVVLDNIGDGSQLTGNTHAAQDFETAYNAYDCAVIDDFEMPGPGWWIDSIEAMIGFWNADPLGDIDDPTGFNIGIFSSSALISTTLIGDVAHIANVPYTTGNVATGLVQFDVNIPLDAGTYWVSVQPILSFGTSGQCGIMGSLLGNLNGVQGNPGGGFGIPGNQQPIDASGAYRITGIPEPASLLLLGLGALLIRRR
ncbi:MAG: PEP-CTERM sorting domain-containing protein [Planctomycetes bacterium]|nr:PEP-CTERM sorting domain-containing protein [Planctomycetota bacterium]